MGRVKGFLLFSIIISLLLIQSSFVYGQGSFESGINNAVEKINPITRFIIGDISSTQTASAGEILFVKFLVFLLLLIIVTIAVQRIPRLGENGSISFILSFLVSLIAIRYITNGNLIQFIWLPYGALGIVMSSLLPLIIVFFFLQSFGSEFIRKFGWAAFFVIFVFLAIIRKNDLKTDSFIGNFIWIYVAVAVIAGLIFLFDKKIHTMFILHSLDNKDSNQKIIKASEITNQINDLRDRIASAPSKDVVKALNEEIKKAEKRRKDIFKS